MDPENNKCVVNILSSVVCNLGTKSCTINHENENSMNNENVEMDKLLELAKKVDTTEKAFVEKEGIDPLFELANAIDAQTQAVQPLQDYDLSKTSLPLDQHNPPVDNRERVIEINGKRFTSMEAFHKYMLKQNKHKKPARASNLFSKMFSKVQS